MDRRRMMMLAASKPYDAEVEYLQSSGTQYIDTGITPNDYTKIECTIYNTSSSSWYVFGSRAGDTFYFVQTGASSSHSVNGTINGTTLTTGWNRQTDGASLYDIMLESNNGVANYEIENKTLNKSFTDSASYTLLGDNVSVNIYVLAIRPSNILGGISRLYSFKITKNGSVVRDLIPVRVGTVGYMYDKVSRQLFGNSGSGSFTYGNDI